MTQPFDRAAEDLGNIVHLEHVNTRVPDQGVATLFYVSGLGLTRDPYLMTGTDNMWANVGTSQFHLPTGEPQTLRGVTGIVLPDRAQLLRRLERVRALLAGTAFDFREEDTSVLVTSPWGNRIRVHEPDRRFGSITLGLPYVAFEVPRGSAEGIAGFYREVFATPASVQQDESGISASAMVGVDQFFCFLETDRAPPPFDGHHVQIYIANFSGPYRWLLDRNLITAEDSQHQWRFRQIVDPKDQRPLFEIEHEVRSMRHPFFNRHLVNRDPGQTNRSYAPGHEAWRWAMAGVG
ncbi:MAG: hypothetical protein ACREFP_05815 [Acetobacteraceae bacterium]